MIFDDLFEIDKNKELLKYKFSNSTIPIYLIFRSHIFNTIIKNKLNLETNSVNNTKILDKGIFLYLITSFIKNIFFAPKKNIYMFSSEVLFFKKGQFYENKLFTLFYNSFFKNTQLIINSRNRKLKLPKKAKVYYQNVINDLSILIGGINRLNSKDKAAIALFMEQLRLDKNVFLTENQYEEFYSNLIKTAKRKGFLIGAYNLFFRIKKPKLLILEDAHYLGEKAFIIESAKKNGVITAEFQHGYVGNSHYAYNFDVSLYSILKDILPTYFLTFGTYWNKQIRTPAKSVVIGNAHIIDSTQKFLKSPLNQGKQNLLIVSATFHSEEIRSLSKTLLDSKISSKYNILLRPHPSEKHNFEIRYKSLFERGIFFDKNENLYQTLKDASIVIALDFTTVLFESILFTKKIYLKKTDYSNFYESNHIFISFIDEQELLKSINEEQEIEIDSNDIWDTDSYSNFNSFLTQIQ